jgi:hypothetical protein
MVAFHVSHKPYNVLLQCIHCTHMLLFYGSSVKKIVCDFACNSLGQKSFVVCISIAVVFS